MICDIPHYSPVIAYGILLQTFEKHSERKQGLQERMTKCDWKLKWSKEMVSYL